MPLNPLLGKKILSVASDSTLQKTQILLQLSIQSNLYHYSKNKLPVYYLGKKNQQEFEVFLTSPEFEQFKQELETTLAAMITWVEKENILLPDNVDGFSAKESLSIFLDRLKSDFYSNRRIILYSDGKKNLEIIAVLIQNTDIDPELRRLMMINLLSDEGLLHCADGCFTRIQMTAL
ncbi:hypothetical protein RVIR1_13170 [Candidatus Rickettsiella viridis]|uniref:Uncharacterized protein n=1 Tax=Candidatus Rickettsiella viridis TaxID=676208 RepID=A0A2Z5UWF2_9COXI|nr:hypothetical protein [Candidatus Rickettsiella viridis]BBB15764.1 hypothetical protein RVIR1_13170 [Candidatus Rickettsiella viridis]